jgi:nitrate/nitrite-specific signal transduction histidine kinase
MLHDVWSKACQSFSSTLSAAEYQNLQSVRSFEQLSQGISALQSSYRRRNVPKMLERLDPFFQHLDFFTKSVNIFVSSNPAIAALVWGSFYTVLQVSMAILIICTNHLFIWVLISNNEY